MRNIIITRGIPGSGKSTFIKEKGLQNWSISPDTMRLIYNAPSYNLEGQEIRQEINNEEIFSFLYKIIEKRMIAKELIVYDATNISFDKLQRIKKLSDDYRYRLTIVDFSDIPLQECLDRNKNREFSVPEEVVLRMYSNLEEEKGKGISTKYNIIKPEEFDEHFSYEPIDLSHWKKIHHIGDIHGCYTVLREYLDSSLKEDELYVFVGDYLERGIENAEVLKFISRISTMKNVVLLEGNHERHLWDYSNGKRKLDNKTFEEIKEFELKEIRRLCRKFRSFLYYKYNEKEVLVSHAGLSFMPKELYKIQESLFIKGIGDYGTDLRPYWDNSTHKNLYQVHGHRNLNRIPIISKESRVFNLEGQVEFGRDLRVLTLDKNGFEEYYIRNNIVDTKELSKIKDIDLSPKEYLDCLRDNYLINEKRFGDISSFNFSRFAFYDKTWDLQSLKARGLFINTKTYEIVARSYDKFFNAGELNENPSLSFSEEINDDFKQLIKYPLTTYKKENGFLGITGIDTSTGEYIIASKSTPEGLYRNWFNDLLRENLGENLDDFFMDLEKLNCSAVFEVVDVDNDPHIIKYDKSKIILLDLIKREQHFNKLSYEELIEFAAKYNFLFKERAWILNNEKEFIDFYEECKISEDKFEGYVLEDFNNFMFKIKLPYYNVWSRVRSSLERYYKILELSKVSNLNEVNLKEKFFVGIFENENEIYKFIDEQNLYHMPLLDIQEKWNNKNK